MGPSPNHHRRRPATHVNQPTKGETKGGSEGGPTTGYRTLTEHKSDDEEDEDGEREEQTKQAHQVTKDDALVRCTPPRLPCVPKVLTKGWMIKLLKDEWQLAQPQPWVH